MNASTATDTARSITPLQRFFWLLKRELWEHKSSLLWTPLAVGIITFIIGTVSVVTGQVFINSDFANSSHAGVSIAIDSDTQPQVADSLTANLHGKNTRQLIAALLEYSRTHHEENHAAIINLITHQNITLMMILLGFIVFFYLLSSLYDDRRDRSILFWKSLPVSDMQITLSKVVTALLVAPLICIVLGVLLNIFGAILIVVFLYINDIDPVQVYLRYLQFEPFLVATVGWLPIYIAWAMPTVGWLLLCSAWARRLPPFLWAVGVPMIAGMLLSWTVVLLRKSQGIEYFTSWLWLDVITRMLMGVFPASHLLPNSNTLAQYTENLTGSPNSAPEITTWLELDSALTGLQLFSQPSLWIGIIAGVVMIALAVFLRRRCDYV